MTAQELAAVLDKHAKYLAGEEGGEKANLLWADLRGANLLWADLRRANLLWADLRGANLSRANLRGANLSRADLRGADLIKADLIKANLLWADLRGANLSGAAMGGQGFAINPQPGSADLTRRVCERALAPGCLNMATWHTCETTHCLAGWAVTLAGDAGSLLERHTSPSVAGTMLCPDLAPYFYATDEEAMEACRNWLAEHPEAEAALNTKEGE